jgi:hypothetical protein
MIRREGVPMINGPNGPPYDPHIEPTIGLLIFTWVLAIVLIAAIGYSIFEILIVARRRKLPHTKLITVLAFVPLGGLLLQGYLGMIILFGGLTVLSLWVHMTPRRRGS